MQTQQYSKPKTFDQFLSKLLKYELSFWTFWKNHGPHSWSISKIRDCEKRGYLNS